MVQTKIQLCKNVRIREEEFGGILIKKGGKLEQVDKIGFELLTLIKDNVSLDDIIRTMKDKYEGDPDEIEKDIHKFIKELQEGGVVEIENY